MVSNKQQENEILEKMKYLKVDVHRDPRKVAAGRAAFLQEANKIAKSVSPEQEQRHKKWNQKQTTHFFVRRKERAPMLTTLTSILIAIGLLLGGGGVTVAAAQASLPEDALYNLKLLSESTLMSVTSSPDSQFDLALDFLDRRAAEIEDLVLAGEMPSDETQTRYRDQVEQAIILALNLPADQVSQAFEQIQNHLQTQDEAFVMLQNNGAETQNMVLSQTRNMIQERLQILEVGLNNMNQNQQQNGNPAELLTPLSGLGNQPTTETGNGNPWTTGTPTPGSGYGPGESSNPWTTGTPTPGSGYGPGESSNPWTTGTPTPGSGYGPGDGTGYCTTCTPAYNGQTSSTPGQGNDSGAGHH